MLNEVTYLLNDMDILGCYTLVPSIQEFLPALINLE